MEGVVPVELRRDGEEERTETKGKESTAKQKHRTVGPGTGGRGESVRLHAALFPSLSQGHTDWLKGSPREKGYLSPSITTT